jgi:hypothetical protein
MDSLLEYVGILMLLDGARYELLRRVRFLADGVGFSSKPSTTTVLYTVSLSADNGGNTKPPEG